MNHTLAASTPPLGWNSWDCYGAAVTEDEIRGNAEYMAEHLKDFGWQLYRTVDIQWYEPLARFFAISSVRSHFIIDENIRDLCLPRIGFPPLQVDKNQAIIRLRS